MAAIVDRASSALHEHSPAPIIPQRRPREPSIEIIDVDQLDESDYVPRAGPSGTHNHASQRRRHVSPSSSVVVLDSDDEDYDPSIFSSSTANSRVNSRSQSALPPPDPLPPMRRHPPPFPSDSGPVMANPMAVDYERFLPEGFLPTNRPVRASGPGTSAGPSTSFSSARRTATTATGTRAGGGIITSAQANAAQRRADRDRLARLRAAGTTIPRFRSRPPRPPIDDMHFVGVFRHHFDPLDNDFDFINGLVRYGPNFIRPAQPKTEEPDYLPTYTHPEPAAPGFCFDFDPSAQSSEQSTAASFGSKQSSSPPPPPSIASSRENPIELDDDGEVIVPKAGPVASSSTSRSTTEVASPPTISLVCSRCLDPLLLGEGASAAALKLAVSGASAEQVEAEQRARKLWGLRCGHLIDGKCLDALGYPLGALDCGKQPLDLKGKGKIKAEDPDDAESDAEEDASSPAETFFNPIRSRLRSATQAAVSTNVNPSDSDSGLGRYIPTSIAHLFGGGSSASRPKSKPKKPRRKSRKVQETFEWTCPVTKCGKLHKSVKIGGVWGPEKEKGEGAITMYI